jgi:murein DD-endopeptidase MepM/ murein hydrolase activator NlpD
VLVATAVLVATLGVVKFLDISADTPDRIEAYSAPQVVSTPLDLPGSPRPYEPIDTGASANSEPPTAVGTLVLPLLSASPQLEAAGRSVPAASPAIETAAPEPETAATPDPGDEAPPEPSLLASINPHSTVDAPEPLVGQPGVSVEPQTQADAAPQWVTHTVDKGESLARIFAEHDLEPALLHRIVNSSKQAKALSKIQPGQTLRLRFDDAGELTTLEHHRTRVEHLRIAVADDEIESEVISKAVDRRTASASGVIASSLFVDGQKAGLSDAKIMELADIFGWDIDFALELRAGDEFYLVYEEHFLDGEKLRDGPILAAQFSNRGETFRAVRYENNDGEVGYYDDTGHSKRRAFLRTPIKFARISSRFNPKRWHPVLKRWRSHKGVDYAAPTGTPIKASGDGKVIFRGTKGGYGRTVIIQHAGKYTTLYAHMSKYSKRARSGARVKQGQVIGYVGKSGLASGPHLHYEFRVNGKHKDPLRVKLPKSLALPKKELPAFRAATAPLLAQLDDVSRDTMVASIDSDQTSQ